MRPRRCFGVVLHSKERDRFVPHTFKRAVVQIKVGHLNFAFLERIRIDREIMVVRRDLDFAGSLLANGMISTVMSEFKFVGLTAEGEADQLMAQTDPKDRRLTRQSANTLVCVGDRLGIAGTV